jgi:hypothetical protein
MSRSPVLLLRALIVLIAVGALFAQIRIVPFIATGLAEDAGHAAAGVPYAIAGITVIACGELVLVALWVLLSQVRRGSIFSGMALRWVDIILGAAVAATIALLAVAAHVALVLEPPLDAPGLTAIAGGLVVCAGAFTLLMCVMRALLRSATTLQAELSEVV